MKDVDWAIFTQGISIDADGNGTIQKKIPATALNFYARLLLPLGSDVTIESPAELVQTIRQYAYKLLEHYKGKP